MQPIPETIQALTNLGATDEVDLVAELVELADRAQEVVPDLVGVSIARLDEGFTFTLVATAQEIAVLDGIQYLAGGPCVDGAHTNQVIEFDNNDALDEDRWRLFAQATAADNVRTTLTLPLLTQWHVSGTVNLYAASQRAFVGHHDELAEIFGGWAAGAMTNADMAFTTRRTAQAAPQQLREQLDIDLATGIIAARLGMEVKAALAHLRQAATRSGVTLSQLAHTIVQSRRSQDAEED
jgi:GAF domain-containing protein